MMRIEHSDMRGAQVVCLVWKDVRKPPFKAKSRP